MGTKTWGNSELDLSSPVPSVFQRHPGCLPGLFLGTEPPNPPVLLCRLGFILAVGGSMEKRIPWKSICWLFCCTPAWGGAGGGSRECSGIIPNFSGAASSGPPLMVKPKPRWLTKLKKIQYFSLVGDPSPDRFLLGAGGW